MIVNNEIALSKRLHVLLLKKIHKTSQRIYKNLSQNIDMNSSITYTNADLLHFWCPYRSLMCHIVKKTYGWAICPFYGHILRHCVLFLLHSDLLGPCFGIEILIELHQNLETNQKPSIQQSLSACLVHTFGWQHSHNLVTTREIAPEFVLMKPNLPSVNTP